MKPLSISGKGAKAMYNPYFQPYQPMDQLSQLRGQQQHSGGIVWVQGLEAAKSYMVAPGASVMLMDSESQTFYIKSTDPSGMPLPLRVFEYKERTSQQPVDYITRQEFDEFKKMIGGTKDEPAV